MAHIPADRSELRSRLKKPYHVFLQEEAKRRGMSIADFIQEGIDVYKDRSPHSPHQFPIS